ncbi:hypothetical protein ACFPAF_08600 [Hymenobacter endophyticus]|uniref:Uncharacterized protein n=1 Tax=Hymenobacter endophyticus TaxID=3076335 RepID=A0ABU3TGF6_9BACT|nr:hypothetical protein [Hymenobacter endophyticus]MDU0370446.1 hypothetical protein [Hymenobacter endophyticus]
MISDLSMKVELVPVVDISSLVIDWQLAGPRPASNFIHNPLQWEQYQARILQIAGFNDYKRVLPGSHFLTVGDWTLPDLQKLIQAHLHPADEVVAAADSCALFGGGILFLDDTPVVIPQCCGTLADLYRWQALVEPQFQSGYFCMEGHPCPKATRQGSMLRITCHDEDEMFDQPTLLQFSVEIQALAAAISAAERTLTTLCEKVDRLSSSFGVQKLSDHLIRGK